jgi:hypothetical protein
VRLQLLSPLRLICLVSLLAILVACGGTAAPATPTTRPTPDSTTPTAGTAAAATTGTPEPTSSAVPTAGTTIPAPTLEAELLATVRADLPPTATPASEDLEPASFEDIAAFQLDVPDDDRAFWVLFSTGFRGVEREHFLSIYTRSSATWEEIASIDLELMDLVFEEEVSQVDITPDLAWIEIRGGAGAHSSVYDLLSFDGTTLSRELIASNAGGFAGEREDFNEDGIAEVVLNQSDPYIFCYACGVVEQYYQIARWDGTTMSDWILTPLPDTASDELRDAMDEAIALAQAGLWLDATLLLDEVDELNADEENEIAFWNSTQMRLTADTRAEQTRTGEYPLLDNLFYGDYTAIMGILSGYSAEELFSTPNPLVAGTVAEGWETELATTIQDYTSRALEQQPDLAAAYFLRGWSHNLENPQSAAALTNVQRAAELEPDQPLFTESAELLAAGGVAVDNANAIQEAAQAYMRARTGQENIEATITIDKMEGNFARVTITSSDDSEPLPIFLQRAETGQWNVITEPDAPVLDPQTYEQRGIPAGLLENLDTRVADAAVKQAIADTVTTYAAQTGEAVVADVEVWAIEDGYAYVNIIPPDPEVTPPTRGIVAWSEGQWQVQTLGTDLEPQALAEEGVPVNLASLETDIFIAVTRHIQSQEDAPGMASIEIQTVDGDYARARVIPRGDNAESATAFLHRQDERWMVLAYGTGINDEQLEGIPESVR